MVRRGTGHGARERKGQQRTRTVPCPMGLAAAPRYRSPRISRRSQRGTILLWPCSSLRLCGGSAIRHDLYPNRYRARATGPDLARRGSRGCMRGPKRPSSASPRNSLSHPDEFSSQIMRAFDVPPWIAGPYRKPRFAWLRWKCRKVWPIKAEQEGPLPSGLFGGIEARERAFVEHKLTPHMRYLEERLSEQLEQHREEEEA